MTAHARPVRKPAKNGRPLHARIWPSLPEPAQCPMGIGRASFGLGLFKWASPMEQQWTCFVAMKRHTLEFPSRFSVSIWNESMAPLPSLTHLFSVCDTIMLSWFIHIPLSHKLELCTRAGSFYALFKYWSALFAFLWSDSVFSHCFFSCTIQ